MNRFVQLHLLTSYPPSNLNRDDLGRPKTAVMGNALRLRISSQSLKRAWRTSNTFQDALSGHVGKRTKEIGKEVYKLLKEKGVTDKKAHDWSGEIAAVFGKRKSPQKEKPAKSDTDTEAKIDKLQDLEIEQLAHFSPDEWDAVMALAETLASEDRSPSKDELNLLRAKNQAADIALFGRMLAAVPRFNVEAAAQVAHAISVHRVQVEDDFFTAVDDLNKGEEDVGAGHIGETEFGAAVYYLYICINREQLIKNLDGNQELANQTLAALVECTTQVAPSGKQNSFASRAYASYLLAEKGDQQPRSLSVAFLNPTRSHEVLDDAINAMEATRTNMDKVYGACANDHTIMNAVKGEGSLDAIKDFVVTE